jgi:hypothetical protein
MSWPVTAGLTRLMLKNYAGFAVLVVTLFSGIWLYYASGMDINRSIWVIADLMPIRFFLLAMGAVVASTYFPVFIATGVTRREFLRGGLLHCVLISAAFAVLTLGGYLLEQVAFGLARPTSHLTHPLPVGGISDALAILGESTVLNFGYMCAGWAIAAGVYRWGSLSGFAVVPVVAAPVLLATGLASISFVRGWAVSAGVGTPAHLVGPAAGNVLGMALSIGVLVAMVILTVRRLPLQPVKS